MARSLISLGLSLGGLVFLVPAPAQALELSSNPFAIDHPGGASGQVELVDVVLGLPTGGMVTGGVVSPTSLTLVLRASVDADSSPPGSGLGLAVRDALDDALPVSGHGHLPGPGADLLITGSAGGEVTFVFATQAPGTVFDLVFLSYDVPLAEDGTLRLDARLENGAPGGSAAIVPEPASGALVALGVAALAWGYRKPRSGRGW